MTNLHGVSASAPSATDSWRTNDHDHDHAQPNDYDHRQQHDYSHPRERRTETKGDKNGHGVEGRIREDGKREGGQIEGGERGGRQMRVDVPEKDLMQVDGEAREHHERFLVQENPQYEHTARQTGKT